MITTLKSILGLCFLFGVLGSQARAVSPEDFQIVQVYNQYYFAIRSAEFCDKNSFKDTVEQKKFETNFMKVRSEAVKALKRNKPNFSDADLIANIKLMDDRASAKLQQSFEAQGCKSEFMVQGLQWYKNFRSMPPMP